MVKNSKFRWSSPVDRLRAILPTRSNAVAQTIRAGARGVIVGRNIWQRELAAGKQTLAEIAKDHPLCHIR